MFANRNEKFGIGTATPFFDKDLLEFVMDVPLPLMVKTGHHRSMFRLAMEGILRPEIQWRPDKLPYSPFSQKRLFASVAQLASIKASIPGRIGPSIIDKNVMADFISTIKALPEQGKLGQLHGIRIAQAGIMSLIINCLLQKGYKIDEC
jgi:asparagine synthase (glutamine-hydrolysing)